MTRKTEAQKKAQKAYMEKFARIEIRMSLDDRDILKTHAESMLESVNVFVNRAIRETIQRDNHIQELDISRLEESYYGLIDKKYHVFPLRNPQPIGDNPHYELEIKRAFYEHGIEDSESMAPHVDQFVNDQSNEPKSYLLEHFISYLFEKSLSK